MFKNFKLVISIFLSIILLINPVSNIYAISSNNDFYNREILSKNLDENDEVSSNKSLKENSNGIEINNSQTKENTLIESFADAGEVEVSNWSEFESAYNDASVEKIKLTSDIEKTTTAALKARSTSIEIDGRRVHPDENGNYYYKLALSFNNTNSTLPFKAATEVQIFDMHDLIISQKGIGSITAGNGPTTKKAFITQSALADSRNWKFRFGNISTDNTADIEGAAIGRLLMAISAEITFYGAVNLRTTAEIAYPGSVVFERNTEFMGKVVAKNVSCFWYYSSTGGTGSSRNFTALDGAKVNLQGSNGTTYPAIYEQYNTVEIGEENGSGADFSITMKGYPYDTYKVGQKFIANANSKVNITTTGTSNVINLDAANSEFHIRKDAEFYAIAKPNYYIINITGGNSVFKIDSAAKYDIRHMGKGQAINNYYNTSHVYLNNVDISFWDKGKDYMGPATYDFGDIESFDGPGGTTAATSSSENLANKFNETENRLAKFQKYSRISGINTKPEVEFVTREEASTSTNWVPSPNDSNRIFSVTDADKKVEARVIKGWVPDDNGIDEFGNVNLIPVYTESSYADITLYSSIDNEEHTMTADSEGLYKYTLSDYYPAGTIIKAYATKKLDNSQDNKGQVSEIEVRDATPPDPVTLITNVDMLTKKIVGTGEPGATITYKINGTDANENGAQITAIVDENRKWEVNTPEETGASGQVFEIGDILQFFSTDSVGNTTPINQVTYRDRTFEKGTIITIVDGSLTFQVPSSITFGDIYYTVQNGAKGWGNIADQTLDVTDTRTVKKEWTLKARMSKQLTNTDGTKTYDNAIYYVFNNDSRQALTDNLILIKSHKNEDNAPFVLLENDRKNGQGLYIDVPATRIISGEYSATIEWNLEDVPIIP
ncbi:pectate lyase-like adhesive domain-containing protein [Metaclostridioides mangenotii]|uniref:Uncharacterized protein n=1 Tax=Metaclostridioides mangenotii TaxID=1540 RepID=A0ABS4E8X1_9FIRM|nr:pectate lyase-like adhesive domain-containing protein [Clostridioides mangenotii]MBP1854390.1 hypothetical protein [Clostridioides mangenotii]